MGMNPNRGRPGPATTVRWLTPAPIGTRRPSLGWMRRQRWASGILGPGDCIFGSDWICSAVAVISEPCPSALRRQAQLLSGRDTSWHIASAIRSDVECASCVDCSPPC